MSITPPHAPVASARIARLFIYPVKSCAGIELPQALLTDAGLDLDRTWMVVGEQGEFVSQRELPRMALIQTRLKHSEVILRAPGMLPLHLRVDAAEEPVRVRLWDDDLPAYDMGPIAAQWFSDFLGQRLRLVRFDPEHRRLSSLQWTGGVEAPNTFGDGFPLLVLGQASLDELNRRLVAGGHGPVGIERFRPNLVLSGLEAHDEDRLDRLRVQADEAVELQLVKPCPRCSIPDVDPATGETGTAVADALQAYRADRRLDGAISFGMNAIVREGDGELLRVGQAVSGDWRF
ncbi:MOSC N-terminal beta barrel domain-containing protein [Ramlibacter sp. AW1]|uniref:MOSC N-terminal beta barrel domain-containing protein n=1 Tax=Ramlibacter aurantiacus TaxID=2801330 RepID=A0A936ZS65_9BURK|nr:MOSC N-terminal beta barrel domain-containing protein [Ramlibacter aurantiacus]MBL0421571.1 MOSC N-terminal beta barrel domain-containing protein [Ramlibacter aurantiacus]